MLVVEGGLPTLCQCGQSWEEFCPGHRHSGYCQHHSVSRLSRPPHSPGLRYIPERGSHTVLRYTYSTYVVVVYESYMHIHTHRSPVWDENTHTKQYTNSVQSAQIDRNYLFLLVSCGFQKVPAEQRNLSPQPVPKGHPFLGTHSWLWEASPEHGLPWYWANSSTVRVRTYKYSENININTCKFKKNTFLSWSPCN
jgi:hypothetical protein